MKFNSEAWREKLKQAKNSEELSALLEEIPERTNMEVALMRGYEGQEAQDFADMLEWSTRIDHAGSMEERYRLIEQMPKHLGHHWANYNHPSYF